MVQVLVLVFLLLVVLDVVLARHRMQMTMT